MFPKSKTRLLTLRRFIFQAEDEDPATALSLAVFLFSILVSRVRFSLKQHICDLKNKNPCCGQLMKSLDQKMSLSNAVLDLKNIIYAR